MSIDKIICVGKNYIDHAKELGDAVPEKPVLFLKPASVLKQASDWQDTVSLQYPSNRGEVHHEIEIVLQVATDGYQLTAEEAKHAIGAVSVGLDMTLRTVQAGLKKNGHPWTLGKVFVDAAIVGPWIPMSQFPDYLETSFSLTVDKEVRQTGIGNIMLMQPVEILMYVSQFFPLKKGDLIFTGTPAGVGAIQPNSDATLTWGDYSYNVKWYTQSV